MFTPYNVVKELTQKDNPALSISVCGYLIATAIIFSSAMLGEFANFEEELLTISGYSILGILLLNLSRVINDKCILYQFSNTKEIIEDRNLGTGVVLFGSYLASGLIIAGAIFAKGQGVLAALVFFTLGQIALIIFTRLYNFLVPYDIHKEIENNNVAVGIGFAGALIAQGIILMKGASADFVNWKHNLILFVLYADLILILLPMVRFSLDKIIIPGANLNREIRDDKKLGAGFLEMAISISFSIVLFCVF